MKYFHFVSVLSSFGLVSLFSFHSKVQWPICVLLFALLGFVSFFFFGFVLLLFYFRNVLQINLSVTLFRVSPQVMIFLKHWKHHKNLFLFSSFCEHLPISIRSNIVQIHTHKYNSSRRRSSSNSNNTAQLIRSTHDSYMKQCSDTIQIESGASSTDWNVRMCGKCVTIVRPYCSTTVQ